MNILHKIVDRKREEIILAKAQKSIAELKEMPLYDRVPLSMSQRIRAPHSSGIIAEFKRHSPSKKWINKTAKIVSTVLGYEEAGVAGSSVLTDEHFFKGTLLDLMEVKKAVKIPLLRKDFIVDPYQVYEARAYGADTILLIASILTPGEVASLTELTHELGMEVLLELYEEFELEHVHSDVDMVGINNRSLITFEVDKERSARMVDKLNVKFVKIAESGIDSPEMINYFRGVGFDGFLIGENFMKSRNPAQACKNFIQSI